MDVSENSLLPLENSLPSFEKKEAEPITATGCVDGGRSTMAVHVSGAGLEMTIDTAIDHSTEIICLSAKLELTTQMLSDTSRRLEAAMLRIGQLEAELRASLDLNEIAVGGRQANG
ncbi:MAG: hypothetical protein WCT03_14565 [Candidatus Obscuribacterales bacterium]|jgi:hypothetical protein